MEGLASRGFADSRWLRGVASRTLFPIHADVSELDEEVEDEADEEDARRAFA